LTTIIIVTCLSIGILTFGFYKNNVALIFFSILGILISFLLYENTKSAKDIYEPGYEGEKVLKEKLHSLLPDDYIAYFGFPLSHGQDIDCVLPGPSGLYVIEVKNHVGDIRYSDNGWEQIKIGRSGNTYYGNLKNPSGQVLAGISEIKKHLESKGIDNFINGVVVFTNPAANQIIEKGPKNSHGL